MKNCRKCGALLKTALSSTQMKKVAMDKMSKGKGKLGKGLIVFGWIIIVGSILLIIFGDGSAVLSAIGAIFVFWGNKMK